MLTFLYLFSDVNMRKLKREALLFLFLVNIRFIQNGDSSFSTYMCCLGISEMSGAPSLC